MDPILSAPFCDNLYAVIILQMKIFQIFLVHHQTAFEN